MRTAMRWLLAAGLLFTGTMHFIALDAFRMLVPPWLPAPDLIVWSTGVAEIAFAVLLVLPMRSRAGVGYALAIFLLLIWPGNIYQALSGVDTFGLDSDAARWVRLPFQPLLILWALWVTQAWPFRERAADPEVN